MSNSILINSNSGELDQHQSSVCLLTELTEKESIEIWDKLTEKEEDAVKGLMELAGFVPNFL